VELATPKEHLRALVEGLTEEEARSALQLVQRLLGAPEENELRAAGIVIPSKAGSFARFEPLIVPGPPSSELLIADRR
jgi:hypothetical protein